MADKDANGYLARDEVFTLCKVSLEKFLNEDEFLNSLSDFFTKIIFSAVNIDINSEIPLDKIQKTILEVKLF